MATEVSIQKTSYGMAEATIAEWLKKEGEQVKEGEPLVTVETEKVNVEIVSPCSGVLRKIIAPKGKVVKVGEIIAIIAEPDEDIDNVLKKISLKKETLFSKEEAILRKKMKESFSGKEEVIPLRGVRKEIAEHMLRSKKVSAHATTFNEADVSKALKLLEESNKEISFTSLLVKAAVSALKDFPFLNSSLTEDKIIVKKYYHIGIAVNIEDGLIVPIIKDADKKNLSEITKEIRRLASLAKEDALSIEEIKGGTFTISNAGMYGSLFFTPIINQPQSAILGVGKIAQRPVAVDSELVIKPMIYLCLSYDHRIVDGALAQQFLEKVKQNIEDFGKTPVDKKIDGIN